MIWMGRTCCIIDTMAFVRYTAKMPIIMKLASHTRREKDKINTYVRKYHTKVHSLIQVGCPLILAFGACMSLKDGKGKQKGFEEKQQCPV